MKVGKNVRISIIGFILFFSLFGMSLIPVKADYQYTYTKILKRHETWLAWRDYKVKFTINVKTYYTTDYLGDSSLYFYTQTVGFWPPSMKNFKITYKNNDGEWKYDGWIGDTYIVHHDDNEKTISSTFPTATDTWDSLQSPWTNNFVWDCTWNFDYGDDTGEYAFWFIA